LRGALALDFSLDTEVAKSSPHRLRLAHPPTLADAPHMCVHRQLLLMLMVRSLGASTALPSTGLA